MGLIEFFLIFLIDIVHFYNLIIKFMKGIYFRSQVN